MDKDDSTLALNVSKLLCNICGNGIDHIYTSTQYGQDHLSPEPLYPLVDDICRDVEYLSSRLVELSSTNPATDLSLYATGVIDIISLTRSPIVRKCALFAISIKSLLKGGRGEGKDIYRQNQLKAIELRMQEIPVDCQAFRTKCEQIRASWQHFAASATQVTTQTISDELPSSPFSVVWFFTTVTSYIWFLWAPSIPSPVESMDDALQALSLILQHLLLSVERIEVYWLRRLDLLREGNVGMKASWEQLENFEPAWNHFHEHCSALSVQLYGAGRSVANLVPSASLSDLWLVEPIQIHLTHPITN